uniref:Uncharacterized protein n=1 Tax=Oryza punctata TaxID=4537 RepID=A0A0E0JJG5_ORYPU
MTDEISQLDWENPKRQKARRNINSIHRRNQSKEKKKERKRKAAVFQRSTESKVEGKKRKFNSTNKNSKKGEEKTESPCGSCSCSSPRQRQTILPPGPPSPPRRLTPSLSREAAGEICLRRSPARAVGFIA